MSCYWFNIQELKTKYHDCVGKEKAAEIILKTGNFNRKSKK